MLCTQSILRETVGGVEVDVWLMAAEIVAGVERKYGFEGSVECTRRALATCRGYYVIGRAIIARVMPSVK